MYIGKMRFSSTCPSMQGQRAYKRWLSAPRCGVVKVRAHLSKPALTPPGERRPTIGKVPDGDRCDGVAADGYLIIKQWQVEHYLRSKLNRHVRWPVGFPTATMDDVPRGDHLSVSANHDHLSLCTFDLHCSHATPKTFELKKKPVKDFISRNRSGRPQGTPECATPARLLPDYVK